MSIRVGLVGTGYAAKVRAEAFQSDPRSHLVAVAGHEPKNTATFAQSYGAATVSDWPRLIDRTDLDLIVVSTVNALHGPIVQAALEADLAVVVEYPLCLDFGQAARLVELAAKQQQFLHVEHIELLGGLHQAMQGAIAQVGTPTYASYRTLNPQHPAPAKWTYHPALFGFPLIAALSRIHRLVNLFGPVETVSCQSRFDPATEQAEPYYGTCLCSARLQFRSGLIAEVTYGKGEHLWQYSRRIEVQGSRGSLVFDRDEGQLTTATGTTPVEVAPRRGLFVQDTAAVLDALTEGSSLYVSAEESLYALKVAEAARQSASSGQTIGLDAV